MHTLKNVSYSGLICLRNYNINNDTQDKEEEQKNNPISTVICADSYKSIFNNL